MSSGAEGAKESGAASAAPDLPLFERHAKLLLEASAIRPDVVRERGYFSASARKTLAQLGFAAITRSSGSSGLDAAEKLSPRAVVLDLLMPEMDGVEFLDRFRRIPEHVTTPVLIWTMKDLTAAEQEKLRQTAQGIVLKNGDTPSTVVAQLRALLPQGGR